MEHSKTEVCAKKRKCPAPTSFITEAAVNIFVTPRTACRMRCDSDVSWCTCSELLTTSSKLFLAKRFCPLNTNPTKVPLSHGASPGIEIRHGRRLVIFKVYHPGSHTGAAPRGTHLMLQHAAKGCKGKHLDNLRILKKTLIKWKCITNLRSQFKKTQHEIWSQVILLPWCCTAMLTLQLYSSLFFWATSSRGTGNGSVWRRWTMADSHQLLKCDSHWWVPLSYAIVPPFELS